MNYNLKNKTLFVIALLFAVTMSARNTCSAADTPSLSAAPVAETAQKTANAIDNAATKTAEATKDAAAANKAEAERIAAEAKAAMAAAEERASKNLAAIDAEEKKAMDNLKELDAEIAAVKEELRALNADLEDTDAVSMAKSLDDELAFLEDNRPNELTELTDSMKVPQPVPGAEKPAEVAPDNQAPNAQQNAPAANQAPQNGANPAATGNDSLAAGAGDELSPDAEKNANIPNTEAPKSPLENFGNAILSKVDNSLFNKMSTIEKQTTLLRLEYKREELKNKVIALRTARLRAMQEEIERRRAYEEKLKNAEAERQAKILEEQRKLKEREMELEKLRQAKVINDYMNEMLRMNQKWIEENAKLQDRIHELEDERVALIDDFKDKLSDIAQYLEILKKHVIAAVQEHFTVVNTLREKIADLQQVIADREEQLRACREAGANQFGGEGGYSGVSAPSQVDVDLSQEYAILDITGQGDEIVAKLVSIDGKTFIVHKGSMLKGGEVVTAITDTYISFENKGIKSYLYTGGSIREYEPEATFNDTSEDFFAPTAATEAARNKSDSVADESAKTDNKSKGDEEKPKVNKKEKAPAATKPAPKNNNNNNNNTSRRSSSSSSSSGSRSMRIGSGLGVMK